MDMSAHNLKPYIIALLIFVCGAIVINYLAVPNTLSHDKLNGELFLIKSQHPEFFSKDYIFEGTSWYFFYVPFLEFIRLLNGFTGASEESYRLLVPIAFFIFTFGMFTFFYRLGNRFSASVAVAVLSSIFIEEVLHENWGIPGPSLISYRHIALAFLPFSFLMYYVFFNNPRRLPLAFLSVGFIANIHPVSGFYVTLIFLGTFLIVKELGQETIKRVFVLGFWALIGTIPFVLWHFVLYPTHQEQFIIRDPAYLSALWAAQPHMSPEGMFLLYKRLFITNWYTFWPLFAICAFTLTKRWGQTMSLGLVKKISLAIIITIAAITFFISIAQQFLQTFFGIAPVIIEEPRAFRFIYFVLYLHAAFSVTHIWNTTQRSTIAKQKIAIGAIAVFIAVFVVIVGYQKAHRTISLIALKKNDPNIGLTCKSPMYQWISGNTDTEDLFLIDPNRFPPFRICALRAVVYHYRDVTPIINSKEKLVEWHKRKQIIEEAYGTRDGKAIVDVANRFGVKYVVSEGCIPIPGHEPVYRDGKFDCVYKVLTDYK
ncbi:MAG: hypothetical protein A2934_05765 [Candidatus Sungbacteria bacterium RIFCSPLOWO2_01_FULL_47_10]|uniref:DUF6798 domain-containing protein n=1 Tax=Candidatus Sungbacteria bacterium RIFCSPLOWO2_01_FULL_47_10 TaxID=1802276 RepID=A0A1G2L3W0_9BACT|nr:MAG: hypothetical protein A2934_05765 [Candidatus Sungbacteria bacterium RIFCSPLOWO2_01_FULL_47_10]